MKKMCIESLSCIFIKNKKILCVRSKGRDLFYLPGGKREQGETDKQTLLREIKEELSVNLIEESILKYGVFKGQADSKLNGVMIKLICYIANFSGKLKISSEIEEFKWLSYLDKDKIPVAGYQVFDDLKKKDLII
ncbi:MAG: NUDIX hydrolase [Alphaproteobacteria bacterium]